MKNFYRLKKKRRLGLFRADRRRKHTSFASGIFFGILVILLALLGFYQFFITAPDSFPVDQLIDVEEGETLEQVAQKLKSDGYVRNANILQWAVMLLKEDSKIIAGSYSFDERLGAIALAKRLSTGGFGTPPKAITFPEGFTTEQMATRASEVFPNVSYGVFVRLAKPREGFLFPDTYEFFSNVEAREIIETMMENFNVKTHDLKMKIEEKRNHTFREIIIMASILEEEAITLRSRRIISGILWRRLEIGMPLQVDAPFAYAFGKSTYDLTLEDLKTPSLYNTYLHKGLPVGPISNPGIEAIRAAMNPIESDYLYYLSDRDGNVYYSTTLANHRELKEKYVN